MPVGIGRMRERVYRQHPKAISNLLPPSELEVAVSSSSASAIYPPLKI